jgi:hypothetical protein
MMFTDRGGVYKRAATSDNQPLSGNKDEDRIGKNSSPVKEMIEGGNKKQMKDSSLIGP